MDNFKIDAGQFIFDITVSRSLDQASIQWVPAALSSMVRRLECLNPGCVEHIYYTTESVWFILA